MNEITDNLQFFSRIGTPVILPQIIVELEKYIREDPERQYDIMVGTDSEHRINSIDFVTVIAIHRRGLGGRYFYRHFLYESTTYDLRKRIWEEVNLSLKLSGLLVEQLKKLGIIFNFELHVDVGPNGATKNMLQEIMQTVRAMGYSVKVKPESYAASTLADHHI